MPTPLSHAGRLLAGLERRGMPVAEFALAARLEGIPAASKTKLNEYFRDIPMPNNIGERCLALWADIERLCVQMEPLELNLSDGLRVYQWVRDFREEKLKIAFANKSEVRSAFLQGMLAGLGGGEDNGSI
jgi:hypothetical protein